MAAWDGKSLSLKFSTCLTKLASAKIIQSSNPIRSYHWSQTAPGYARAWQKRHCISSLVSFILQFYSIPFPSLPFHSIFHLALVHWFITHSGSMVLDSTLSWILVLFALRALSKTGFWQKGLVFGGCTTTWGAFDVIMHPMRAICLAHAKRETLEPHWTENIPAGTPLHLDQFGFHDIGRHWEYSCPVVRHVSRKHIQGWRLLWCRSWSKKFGSWIQPSSETDAAKKCWFPNGPKHGIRSEASRIKTTALSLENLISC